MIVKFLELVIASLPSEVTGIGSFAGTVMASEVTGIGSSAGTVMAATKKIVNHIECILILDNHVNWFYPYLHYTVLFL